MVEVISIGLIALISQRSEVSSLDLSSHQDCARTFVHDFESESLVETHRRVAPRRADRDGGVLWIRFDQLRQQRRPNATLAMPWLDREGKFRRRSFAFLAPAGWET
jgi:hypothetical protein